MPQSKRDKLIAIKMRESQNKGSPLYQEFVKKFPDSRIAKDAGKGFPHGGFGNNLKEGKIENAIFSADLENTLRLKKLGAERFLDNKGERTQFEAHAKYAEDKGIKV